MHSSSSSLHSTVLPSLVSSQFLRKDTGGCGSSMSKLGWGKQAWGIVSPRSTEYLHTTVSSMNPFDQGSTNSSVFADWIKAQRPQKQRRSGCLCKLIRIHHRHAPRCECCAPSSATEWWWEQPAAGGGSSPLSSVCRNRSWWTIKIMGDPEYKKSPRQMEEI